MEKQKEDFDEVKEAVFLYSKMLVKIAYTYLKSMHDAEDVVQDVFLVYLAKNVKFDSEDYKRNWLVRCTINKCKDLLKASWYKSWIPIPEEIEYQDREESEVIQLVLKLERKYRIPIYLHYCEGYSLKEIAELLGKKVSSVGTLLARGKKKLEAMIEEDQIYGKGEKR